MNFQTLDNDQLLTQAPAIFANKPAEHTSKRYTFVPTIDVINALRSTGWFPTKAEQARVNKRERQGFQRHIVRFANKSLDNVGDSRLEVVVVNSHDAGSSFQMYAGVFRMVCTNGMVVGNKQFECRSIHSGKSPMEMLAGANKILDHADDVGNMIGTASTIELTPDEKGVFAMAAHALVYDPEERAPITSDQLLRTRRTADYDPDLWTTQNVVQENLIKGGLHGWTRDKKNRPRRTKTRPVKSIDRNIKLNRAIWTLGQEMARLKGAA